MSPDYNADLAVSENPVKSERIDLAVKCRTTEFQVTRDFGHLPAIVRDRKADGFRFDYVQRAHIAITIEERERARLPPTDFRSEQWQVMTGSGRRRLHGFVGLELGSDAARCDEARNL